MHNIIWSVVDILEIRNFSENLQMTIKTLSFKEFYIRILQTCVLDLSNTPRETD